MQAETVQSGKVLHSDCGCKAHEYTRTDAPEPRTSCPQAPTLFVALPITHRAQSCHERTRYPTH